MRSKLLDLALFIATAAVMTAALFVSYSLGRATESSERAEQLICEMQETADRMQVVAVAPQKMPAGEGPDEDALIEAVLVEQGYFREDVPLSYALQDALHTACDEFGVSYELALAVIEVESNFTNATGDGGESIGFFQIQPRWWDGLMEEIGADDLTDPAQNFRTGCAILAELIEQYDGDTAAALTAYNAGSDSGNRTYAGKVLEAAERYGAHIE